MSQAPQIGCDPHSFILRSAKETGESLELIVHDDGGITIATALWQTDFCDATQASLTREQAVQLCEWLSEAVSSAGSQ